jgi:hypothetical protein
MGAGSWSNADYTTYSTKTSYRSATRDEVFTNRKLPEALDPRKILLRESCDSADNPNSTPVILALDVTGSMGEYAERIAKDSLPELMTHIYETRPISNPHIMFMGIDDMHQSKGGPLQVSQFEADIRILEQLRQIWMVEGGGGNRSESYDLAWYFGAYKTKLDSVDKRGKKGFLFTFGDEEAPYEFMSERELKDVFGSTTQVITGAPEDALAAAKEKYHVFHVVIEQGDYCQHSLKRVRSSWTTMLGDNALYLRDFRNLPELVTATMRIAKGEDMDTVLRAAKNPDALRYAYSNALAG